jgi:hypothetical protein
MMKHIPAGIVVMTCLSGSVAFGAPAKHTELADRISKLVRERYPDAHIVGDNGKFSAKHGTMIFTVHRHWKTGEILGKTDQVEGPNYRGFILSVSVAGGKYEGQALVPQTLRRPYWETCIDRPSTEDGKGHYVINFSYGSRLNGDFKKAIFKSFPKSRIPTKQPPRVDVLEGALRVHPKFHYRYFIDGFGDGQECALFQADKRLKQIKPGSRIRVRGNLASKLFGGNPKDRSSALVRTWIIYMVVDQVEILRVPASGRPRINSPPRSPNSARREK